MYMSDSSYAEMGAETMLPALLFANTGNIPSQEQMMKNSLRFASPKFNCAISAVIFGTALLVAGCDKYTSSGQTVGQKLDGAIDKTNAKIAAAGEKVEAKVGQAGAAVTSAGESISNTTGNAINKAGDAVFTKVDQVGVIVDDSAITASIKADLLKDPGLSALGIEVNTVKGEVTLKGEVSTDVRKQRAEGIASHIVGVTKVINNLKVSGA